MFLDASKSYLASKMEAFAEHNSLPPDIKSRLIDLRFEAQLEIDEISRGKSPENYPVQEAMKIQSKCDEDIAALLSENDYAAYKDFQKYENEWGIIGQMKNDFISRELKLEKEQEQRLVTAMYNDRQELMKMQMEKIKKMPMQKEAQRMPFQPLSQKEMLKQGLDQQKIVSSMYVESAKNILSESQLQVFKRYFDYQIYSLEGATTQLQESDDKKEESRE